MTEPDVYAALTPAARLVAQAYGVVAPHGMGVARTARVLSQAGVTLLDRPLTTGEIRVANSEIIDAGVGFRPGGGAKTGVCAADRWAVALAVKAQQEGRLRKILDAFEATRSSLGADRYIFDTLFRCYVIGGDFDDLDLWGANCNSTAIVR